MSFGSRPRVHLLPRAWVSLSAVIAVCQSSSAMPIARHISPSLPRGVRLGLRRLPGPVPDGKLHPP